MIDKEFKINVDRATGKKIAEIVCAEITSSLVKNSKVYDLTRRCERQYSQISKWAHTGKICNAPWTNAADYFVPLTEWIIDAVHARVMNIMFSQEPFLEATGVESSDVDKAKGVTDFVDGIMREVIRVYENTNFFFKQMIKIPMAILKYDTAHEFDRILKKETAMTFINPQTGQQQDILKDDYSVEDKALQLIADGFQPAGEREVFTTEDVPLIDHPDLRYIKFNDYVWAPNTKRGKRPYWEGDRVWLTLNDLKMRAKQDMFIKSSVEMVSNKVASAGSKQGTEKAIEHRAELREAFNWYGRLPFTSQGAIDFEETDVLEQEVVCVVDMKEKELLSISHWHHDRQPHPERVYLRGMFEETNEFWGRSLCQKLFQTQRELNTLHNTIINNANIAMQKIFVMKRSAQGDEYSRPLVHPGAIWEEDMAGDIRVLEVGDVKNIGLQLEATLLNFAERLSNISIFQTGTARSTGGQKTLGEVEKTIAEGNVGLDKFIQRAHYIMRTVAKWTVGYYHEDMPEGLERRIRGDGGEMIFPTDENMQQFNDKDVERYWDADDLAGQFDFLWRGTSLNSSRAINIQIANDLMEQYMPQPMIQGNLLAVWDILRRGLIARNIKDWQKILPKRESVLEEMQKMEQERNEKLQLQNSNKQILESVGEQVIGQGAPAGAGV